MHQRFGHPGRDASIKLGIDPVAECKGCVEGEHPSKSFRKEKVVKQEPKLLWNHFTWTYADHYH